MTEDYIETEEYNADSDEDCVCDDTDQSADYVGGVLANIQDSFED